jgi:hypothetical protein
VLPESPQHTAWLSAQALAGQEIDRFRAETVSSLTEALHTLSASTPVGSDLLFERAEQLRFQLRRLGSASYCLQERAEPTDDHPYIDRDEHAHDANRNTAQLTRSACAAAGPA